MQQFDTVSARLQCVLARAFLNLHSLARQRTPPPSTTADTPAPLRIPTTTQQRNKQTRLTTIWQVPPPHIADAPLPQPPPARTQLLLTSYITAGNAAARPTTTLIPPTAAPAANTPHPPSAQRTHRRRRTLAATDASNNTLQRITTFFPQRVLPPHVATNPANSTPDHDPDKN